MTNESQLVEVIKKAKETDKDRKFTQSVEMIMVFKDVDVKKGFAINETVQLPKKTSKPATVCIMASGDMGIKAKNAKADLVVDENELSKLSGDKKKSKDIINKYGSEAIWPYYYAGTMGLIQRDSINRLRHYFNFSGQYCISWIYTQYCSKLYCYSKSAR